MKDFTNLRAAQVKTSKPIKGLQCVTVCEYHIELPSEATSANTCVVCKVKVEGYLSACPDTSSKDFPFV